MLQDIATLTGGTVISEGSVWSAGKSDLEDTGEAKRCDQQRHTTIHGVGESILGALVELNQSPLFCRARVGRQIPLSKVGAATELK